MFGFVLNVRIASQMGTPIQSDLLGFRVQWTPWADTAQEQKNDYDDNQDRQKHEDPEESALRAMVLFLDTTDQHDVCTLLN
jgi:hypothetical protein